jgi:hypothetical protein
MLVQRHVLSRSGLVTIRDTVRNAYPEQHPVLISSDVTRSAKPRALRRPAPLCGGRCAGDSRARLAHDISRHDSEIALWLRFHKNSACHRTDRGRRRRRPVTESKESVMKKLIVIITLCCASAAAFAQSAPQGANPQRMARMEQQLQSRFSNANTTHDGKLTKQQAAAGMPMVAKHFDEIDTRQAGYITLPQIEAFMQERGAAH